jgi:histidine decarboxylase
LHRFTPRPKANAPLMLTTMCSRSLAIRSCMIAKKRWITHQLYGKNRLKSSSAAFFPLPNDDEDDDNHVIMSANSSATILNSKNINTNSTAAVDESSFFQDNVNKSGTPSPWAVFDAWGAGGAIREPISISDQLKLSHESVRIPIDDNSRSLLPSETDILETYDQLLQRQSSIHFGYPYNLMYNHEEIYRFMRYSINNLGDPFVPSNYGVHSRQFECAVIDFFSHLFKAEPDELWGYVTTCGTEGNLHGILLARECHPDGILYASRESHYSVFKAARYYRMDCISIPTLPMGEIDYEALAKDLEKNRDKPAIINVNIGTTVKGAVDNLDRILNTLEELKIPRDRYHIHCDGALFAMMMPFLDNAPEISFRKNIDSITVSGHKMLGCPMPCGIALSRKEHVQKVEQRIDYLNSVDTTIMGSRNGQSALYMWYSLRKKSIAGIKEEVL